MNRMIQRLCALILLALLLCGCGAKTPAAAEEVPLEGYLFLEEADAGYYLGYELYSGARCKSLTVINFDRLQDALEAYVDDAIRVDPPLSDAEGSTVTGRFADDNTLVSSPQLAAKVVGELQAEHSHHDEILAAMEEFQPSVQVIFENDTMKEYSMSLTIKDI